MVVTLGDLLRKLNTAYYGELGNQATSGFDQIVATDSEVLDARIAAGESGDANYYLTLILAKNRRIPLNGFEPEEVDC